MKPKDIYIAFEEDNYITYDMFVDFIKDYYAPHDNEKAYKIEDFVNATLADMFKKIDEQFA